MKQYIVAIDQGTTSSRCILFDTKFNIIDQVNQEFPQYFPDDGWVEHNPEEIWQTVLNTFQQLVAKNQIKKEQIIALGITNQRETVLLWDKITGKPLYNAIVWQDRRTHAYCNQLKQKGLEETINKKTGLLLDPYFSASKINWILSRPGIRQKADRSEVICGTIDSYLIWKLTAGKSHLTDVTNASRTMLFNLKTLDWDDELLEIFEIPKAILPEVKQNVADFGTSSKDVLGAEIKILGCAGDQQSAAIGQVCFKAGDAKFTYGTGCFALINTGGAINYSKNKLLTVLAYQVGGQVNYGLEGSIFMAGAAVQWLRDSIKIIDSAAETEQLAKAADPNQDVVMVPAFTGLGAPYWDSKARGAIFGMTRNTTNKEIAKATLEAVGFQTRDLLEAFKQDGVQGNATFDLSSLKVDGAMVANDWLCQFISDINSVRVVRPKILETTALGAAFLAAIGAGLYNDLAELNAYWQTSRLFKPELDEQTKEVKYRNWKKYIDKVLVG